jgi:hypothetical protein
MANRALVFSEDQIDLIIKIYGKSSTPSRDLLAHPLFEGYTRWQVQNKAQGLGVTRTRRKLTDKEKEIINRLAGVKTVQEIIKAIRTATGKNRNYYTISGYINRKLHRSVRLEDNYTFKELKEGLRVSQSTIMRWVRQGKLKAHKDKAGPGNYWVFKPRYVAELLILHPFELEGCCVDWPWASSLILEYAKEVHLSHRKKKA